MPNHRVDITNRRFGRLVALEPKYVKEKKATYWRCVCDCGKEKYIRYKDLNYGSYKSCGCYRDEICKISSKKAPGVSALNSIYHTYKVGAKKRNLSFELTKNEFKELVDRNCVICGLEPSNVMKSVNGSYKYTGIDRINSDLGYIKGNCLPMCKDCNFSKGTRSLKEFLQWIERISVFSSSGKNILVIDQPNPKNQENSKPIWELVAQDLIDRKNQGIKKYGKSLKTNNSRDALVDLYQEILDSIFYIRQVIEERDAKS